MSMTIKNVNKLPNNELLVDYFGFNGNVEQKHMKLIDGVVHQTSSSGYMWTPANAQTNFSVLRQLRVKQ
jgi:hypothetical protein